MKILATYSIKGGVGKTTSAVNLAYEAARAGARVLVWDLDPQAAASYFLRAKPKLKGGADRLVSNRGELDPHIRSTEFAAINVIAADFSLRNLDVVLDDVKKPVERLGRLLAPIADRYDVALLDCPPSISLASESVFGAADALLVPTIPTPLSARTLTQLTEFLADWDEPPLVMPYLSMLDRRRSLQRDIAAQLHNEWANMLDTDIPSASIIERMSHERAPVGALAPKSAAARAYRSLWAEISRRIWR
ncbi:MAG: ParA family protein [Ilumatobacteraceae bacterium]